jgi:hypothetical protein
LARTVRTPSGQRSDQRDELVADCQRFLEERHALSVEEPARLVGEAPRSPPEKKMIFWRISGHAADALMRARVR